MKFINAKFFYKKDELINENKYSYWWILMGELASFGGSIACDSGLQSSWDILKKASKSYEIKGSSTVSLNNAYVCGMAKATPIPSVDEGGEENKGTVILNVGGAGSNSIIPFTVGQGKSDIGHKADSLWLIALPKNIMADDDDILKLFPFRIDSSNPGYETQIYTGVTDQNFSLSEPSNCVPLIGYSVESQEAVNNIKYSGFTVGSSVVTLSGLVS